MAAGKSRNKAGKDKRNSLRIIGGQWRGRRLAFQSLPGLRPTGDRLRETLFNWLSPLVIGSRCLDLFAGSGALGLEAVSRGAASCVLVDHSREACNTLEGHCRALEAQQQVRVVHADALEWLRRTEPGPFDIVFLDPPFAGDLLSPAIELLSQPGRLAPNARIYLETPLHQAVAPPAGWQQLRSVEAGQVLCQLWAGNGS